MYSPSLKKDPPPAKLAFGLGTLTSTPANGARSNSGCAISSGCSSGSSGFSTLSNKVSISLSGMMTSPNFLELSVGILLSPRLISATIKKNRPRVIKAANPVPARYLL